MEYTPAGLTVSRGVASSPQCKKSLGLIDPRIKCVVWISVLSRREKLESPGGGDCHRTKNRFQSTIKTRLDFLLRILAAHGNKRFGNMALHISF
jgi:hypothetical protein